MLSFGRNLTEKGSFNLKQTFIFASLLWLQACGAEPRPGIPLCNRETKTRRQSFCLAVFVPMNRCPTWSQWRTSACVVRCSCTMEVTPILPWETCSPHVSKCQSFIQQLFYPVVSTWQPSRRMNCEPAGLVSIHWVKKQSTEQIKQ